MKLSANFDLSELTKSQIAEKKRFTLITPSPGHIDNLKKLCVNVLQPIRSEFDKPVIVSSGYRSGEVNLAIGSSLKSQHIEGKAADIEIPSINNKDLAWWIRNNLEVDQLILEFYKEGEPNSGWVHVSYNEGENRNQYLIASKNKDGKTQYKPW